MGDENSSRAAASDEERASRAVIVSDTDDSSSSSSEDEEGFASPPPNKRRKLRQAEDPRISSLVSQVNCISNYLTKLPVYLSSMGNNPTAAPSNTYTAGQPSGSVPFLTNPCSSTDLRIGDLHTDYDDKRVVPLASEERLVELNKLQHFDRQSWKGIRYKATLRGYAATPGFVGLKVNDELCHFNKTKDYLASSENMLAGLTNANLEQRELLKQALQDLVNWAAANPRDLNPSSLFEKVSVLLGPDTALHRCTEKIMQIICGRRSECIEIRRERIIKEVNNVNLRSTLRNIPPSAEHLFSREALQPVIQSLGGSQAWLNTPTYLKEKTQNQNLRERVSQTNRQDKRTGIINKNNRIDRKPKTTIKKRNNFRRYNNTQGENSSEFTNRQK
ncbi:hypothetical protein ABMA28_000152 [Loxostege sticticalis]|uniref:Uncharacterized protein n=1 Tax=Loxostege sticticalis TaxID=481309 RepID=A0ABD0TRK7_LOXSC